MHSRDPGPDSNQHRLHHTPGIGGGSAGKRPCQRRHRAVATKTGEWDKPRAFATHLLFPDPFVSDELKAFFLLPLIGNSYIVTLCALFNSLAIYILNNHLLALRISTVSSLELVPIRQQKGGRNLEKSKNGEG